MKLILASIAAVGFASSVSAADLPRRSDAPAAPAAASSLDGFGSLALGYNWREAAVEGDTEKGDGLHLNARGSFFAPLSGPFGLQLDGVYERNAYGSHHPVEHVGTIASHVFARNNTGLIGVIGQVSGMTTTGDYSHEHDRRYFIGAEGQYFVNNAVTLYGQLAYQNYDRGTQGVEAPAFSVPFTNPSQADMLNAVAQARFFVSQDVMLMAKLAYETGKMSELSSSIRANSWAVTGKAVYHIHHTPVSVFAEAQYRRSDFKLSDEKFALKATDKETRVLLGVKYSFTDKSLLERDRTGASLDPIEALATSWPTVMVRQ